MLQGPNLWPIFNDSQRVQALIEGIAQKLNLYPLKDIISQISFNRYVYSTQLTFVSMLVKQKENNDHNNYFSQRQTRAQFHRASEHKFCIA